MTSVLLPVYLRLEADLASAPPEEAELARQSLANLRADLTDEDVAWLEARDPTATEAT